MAYLPGVLEWREGDEARLTKRPMSVDGTFASVLEVDTDRGVGVFTSPTGEAASGSGGLRDLWTLNDAPANPKRMRTTFWGSPWIGGNSPDGTILPQHGVALRYKEEGGRRKSVIVWQNIVFGTYWSILAGSWSSDVSGSANFVNRQVGQILPALGDSASVVSSSRDNGVVTVQLAEQAPFVEGSYLIANLATASFDGQFLIEEVQGTRVRWRQDGDNESGGAGTVSNTFPYDIDAWSPDDDNILLLRAKRHNEPDWPEWVDFDTDAGLVFPGGSGNFWSAPAATVATPSQLSFRALVTMADWTPSADQTIIAKYITTGNQRCFWWRVKTTGLMEFIYSPLGSTSGNGTSTVAVPGVNGQPLGLRIDYNEATTSITFYTGPTINGPWTQLGDVRGSLAGMGILDSATAPVEIGGAVNGTNNLLIGRVHALIGFPNLTETSPMIDLCANVQDDADTEFADRASVTWTRQGTASLVNTGKVDGALAWAVDLDEAGTWANRSAAGNSTPADGQPGIVAAHLGTSDLSHVEIGWTAFSDTDELPLDLLDPSNDQSYSLVYWADERDRLYGHPTRDYFLTEDDAEEAAVRIPAGQLVGVRGPGT